MALRIGLFVIAALLAGAHFFRAGNVLLVALSLACPLLFLWRRPSSLVAMQALAYCACGTWIFTAVRLAQARELAGRPWGIAAAILVAVAIFTLAAGLLLNSRSIRDHYPR